MKELSTEEKAKAYDEAINRMKHYVVDEYGCSRIKVADVFPELKESEDERIRKDLIIYLRSILSNKKYGDKFIESWISWLERQGEQKLAWSEENEDTIKFLISHFCVSHCNGMFLFTSDKLITHDELLEKIRNLRPQSQWKPSDEQMGVIEAVINNRSFQRRHLDSLYNDLKKLREE